MSQIVKMSPKKTLEICSRYIHLTNIFFKEDDYSGGGRHEVRYNKSTQRWSLPKKLIPAVASLFDKTKLNISWGMITILVTTMECQGQYLKDRIL